jgi:hypothetical protein
LFANVQVEEKDHATQYMGVGGSRTGYVIDSSGYEHNGTIINSPTVITNSEKNGRYLANTNFNVNTDSVTISPCFSVGQTLSEMTTTI